MRVVQRLQPPPKTGWLIMGMTVMPVTIRLVTVMLVAAWLVRVSVGAGGVIGAVELRIGLPRVVGRLRADTITWSVCARIPGDVRAQFQLTFSVSGI